MKCHLLMTGNELMTGVTVDSNSAYIAEKLQDIGIDVSKKTTVGDVLEDLVHEIVLASTECQLLIINGGLGPTVDDLTALALSRVFEKPLVFNASAEKHVRSWCEKRNMTANDANLKQAILPAGCDILSNPVGSAVGIKMDVTKNNNNCLILCTPGVPSEMRLMIQDEILPLLQNRFPDARQQFTKRLQLFGIGESSAQQKINNEFKAWPKELTLGFRAGMPTLELKLTVQKKSDVPLRDRWEAKIRSLLTEHIFGEGQDTIPSVVINLLTQHQKTICTAESCTGGLIASLITSVPGASRVFEAGFVTYSNTIKTLVLGVDQHTLINEGAVSEAVVLQMAHGALEKSHADFVIAVSGIAGPDGGTAEKPVGTTWIAWGTKEKIQSRKRVYPADRHFYQMLVATYALDLIRRELLQT